MHTTDDAASQASERNALHGLPDSHFPGIFVERRDRIRDAYAALIRGDVDAMEEAIAKATRAGKVCRALIERPATGGTLA